jgi:hypothetical protein
MFRPLWQSPRGGEWPANFNIFDEEIFGFWTIWKLFRKMKENSKNCCDSFKVCNCCQRRVQGFVGGNLRERDHWGDPGVGGRIIRIWIFKK